jgi:hypothetical protein
VVGGSASSIAARNGWKSELADGKIEWKRWPEIFPDGKIFDADGPHWTDPK